MSDLRNTIFFMNTVLKTKRELEFVKKYLKKIGLRLHPRVEGKNWDSFAALNLILNNFGKYHNILDAGGRLDSPILYWLRDFDFENLFCMNLEFKDYVYKDGIFFDPGDITKTNYPDNNFNAVTCISVIEHGINLKSFFSEMKRILKKDGILIISTDFWNPKIDVVDKHAYGNPIKIFNEKEISDIIKISNKANFKLYPGFPLDLEVDEKVIRWESKDLDYTFLIFALVNKK